MAVAAGEAALKSLQAARASGGSGAAAAAAAAPVLVEMKLALVELEADAADADHVHGSLCRQLLENACWVALGTGEADEFARLVAQLKPYYLTGKSAEAEGTDRSVLLGLNLMRLLANKDLKGFHTELELLPASVRASDFVKLPHRLERHLAEGAFNKVIAAAGSKDDVPNDAYLPFLAQLATAVRGDVADCLGKGFEPLAVADADRLLSLGGDKAELQRIADARNWTITDGTIHFKPDVVASHRDSIPSHELIRRALQYTDELERVK